MLNRFIEWIKSFFRKEYEVTIWFRIDKSDRIFSDKEVYHLKSIQKLTNKELRGTTVDGQQVVVKAAISFDYRLKRLL